MQESRGIFIVLLLRVERKARREQKYEVKTKIGEGVSEHEQTASQPFPPFGQTYIYKTLYASDIHALPTEG